MFFPLDAPLERVGFPGFIEPFFHINRSDCLDAFAGGVSVLLNEFYRLVALVLVLSGEFDLPGKRACLTAITTFSLCALTAPQPQSGFWVRNHALCLLRFWTQSTCHPLLEVRSADSKVAGALIKAQLLIHLQGLSRHPRGRKVAFHPLASGLTKGSALLRML
ncbi:hypothetical protein NKDENANG_00676 [Candidatus Entotheonellaceae bacterium PAL068K]